MVGTDPLKLATGVKVKSPEGVTVTVPTFGMVAIEDVLNDPLITPAIVNCVTDNIVLPSISESLANTFTVTGVSSGVVLLSSLTAIGLSFTAVTLILNVPVSVPPFPSLMV